MNEQEKIIELAKLMGWDIKHGYIVGSLDMIPKMLDCYDKCNDGLAQFAAILLKFPEVMMMFAFDKDDDRWLDSKDGDLFHGEPTQETILDEILRMNGVKI